MIHMIQELFGQTLRAFGRLGSSLPADIHPTEVVTQGIDVFAGTIEVYDRGVTLRTYRHVHCYEHEIKTISEIGPSKRVGRRPKADWDAVEDALHLQMKSRGMIGLDNDADWQIKADVERWVSTLLEARNEIVEESTVREHVTKMLARIEAGN
jgi:hypothetical protein